MLKFNQSQYNNADENIPILCTCSHCGKEFTRAKSILSNDLNRYYNIYCSRKCYGETRKKTLEMNCKHCNEIVFRTISEVAKSKSGFVFCNRSCAATYNNTHKTHGTRRSKMEAFLEDYISSNFPNITMLCNDKTAIGSELDFYFPEIQFGIELNGIFHYEPIYGQNKLNKIKNNDSRKIIACYEHGIELAIIDASSVTRLTPIAKAKYAKIAHDLLDLVILSR